MRFFATCNTPCTSRLHGKKIVVATHDNSGSHLIYLYLRIVMRPRLAQRQLVRCAPPPSCNVPQLYRNIMAEVGTPPEGAVPMPVSTGRAKRLEGKVILVTVSSVIAQRSAAGHSQR